MPLPSNYKRAEGFPKTGEGMGGDTAQDCYYCNYADNPTLKWGGDPKGSPCPLNASLCLTSIQGRREGPYVYFDLGYTLADAADIPDSNLPTYEVNGGLLWKPIEQRTGYLAKWNHHLACYDGVKPAFFDTATSTELSLADSQFYAWVKNPEDAPAYTNGKHGKWPIPTGCKRTKQAEEFPVPCDAITEEYKFSSRKMAQAYMKNRGKIKAPKDAMGLSGTSICMGFNLRKEKSIYVLRVMFQIADSVDTDLYDTAT
jgi:hypothetical protein